jgi:membrane fusion protein
VSGSLFRREALNAKSRTFVSETALVSPPGFHSLSAFALLIALTLLAFLFLGSCSRKDTVRGFVTTTVGNVRIYSQSEGSIVRVLVREGQSVRRGDPLLLLSTARASSRSAAVSAALLEALDAEREALVVQLQRERELFDAEYEAAGGEIASLERRLSLARQQEALAAKRFALAEREVQRLRNIADPDLVSDAARDRAAASALDHELRRQELRMEIDRLDAEMTRQQTLREQLPQRRALRIAELQGERHRLAQKLADGAARARQTIVATTSGRVSALTARAGETVSPARPLLSLIPEHSVFYAQLLVPGSAIAFVVPGDRVNLRYDAFPRQKFGIYRGRVTQVAHTVILPGEMVFPVAFSEPAYLVRVEIDRQHVELHGRRFVLQADMTLSADIVKDRRRLIEWLFEPLLATGRRVFS